MKQLRVNVVAVALCPPPFRGVPKAAPLAPALTSAPPRRDPVRSLSTEPASKRRAT